MLNDKFPSSNYTMFLPLIVLIIITVGVLMFFTWGVKKNESTSASLGREDEGTSVPPQAGLGRRDERTQDKPQPFPVYDFSLQKEEIPALGTGIAPVWEDFDTETAPDFKAMVGIKKEMVEPLLGFKTESLVDIVRKQKADALLKSAPREESKRKIPLDAVEE